MQPKRSALIGRKSGVSDVVATVIIIALVIVAVTVVWLGVMPMIRDRVGSSDVCNKVDVSIENSQGYTCWAQDKNVTLVQVKKGSADVNVSKFKFAISSAGNSVSFTNSTIMSRNSYAVYYLNTTGINSVDKIEVVPFAKSGNNEKACSAVYIENVKSCSPTVLSANEIQQASSGGQIVNQDTTYQNGGDTLVTNSKMWPPHIVATSPFNNNIYASAVVPLNVGSDVAADWRYSLNGGANVSFVPNITLSLVNGNYNITIYANNSNGFNSTFLNFSVNAFCNGQNAQGFFNGSGTLASPYGICNCTMLQNMKNYLSGNFSLLNNIDCTGTKNWNWNASIGGYNGFLPIGGGTNSFTGTADGNNYNITNLFINLSGQDFAGLFGAIVFDSASCPGNISRFNLVNVSVTGNKYVGGITGYSQGGSIKNCSSQGNIYGAYEAGGIAGRNYVGLVYSSFSNVNVTGLYYPVTSTYLCGLVGNNYGASAGSPALIINSYAMGKILPYRVGDGGISGFTNTQNSYSFVNNSYSTVNVSIATGGFGFVSNVFGGVVGSSYWDTNSSGKTSGGFGTPRTIEQMKIQGNYVGWDWGTWAIDSKNNGYPYLKWQNL